MKWFGFIAIVCAALILGGAAQAEDDWKMVMDKDGIRSYSRSVPGTGRIEIKAVLVVEAPIENVGEMIRDVPGYVTWMPHCGSGVILDGHRDDADVRVVLDLPWPVTDREILLNAKVSYDLDHGRAFIDLTNLADKFEVFDEDLIRVPVFKGRYTIEYITREKTGIVYQYTADFAGAIPKSLANSISKKFLFKNLSNLRDQVNSAKYNAIGSQSPDAVLCKSILENKDRLDGVVKARLREFIRNEEFVQWLSNEVTLYDLITSEDGRLTELLLYSWRSEEAQAEAVKFVVKKVLESRNVTRLEIDQILNDSGLIQTIRSGEPSDESNSLNALIKRLENNA